MSYALEIKKVRKSELPLFGEMPLVGVRNAGVINLDIQETIVGTLTGTWVEAFNKVNNAEGGRYVVVSNTSATHAAVGVDLDVPTTKYAVVMAGSQRVFEMPAGCSVYVKTV